MAVAVNEVEVVPATEAKPRSRTEQKVAANKRLHRRTRSGAWLNTR